MSPPTKGHHPVTRAKNATQCPGQAVLDYQQKQRSHAEMSKVRAQEHLDKGIAEQYLCTALKMVAKVQVQQQAEVQEEEELVVAPSLCRHETLLPRHINASVADDSTGVTVHSKDSDSLVMTTSIRGN
jgi:hypothetical protein